MKSLYDSPIVSLYEPTVPRVSAARPAPLITDVFGRFVVLPPLKARRAPRLQQLARRLQAVTGWSARTMAQALATTHPTVSALLDGRQVISRKVPELPSRLSAVVDLAERVSIVVDGEAASVNNALTTVPVGQNHSALDHLRARDVGRAYATALDVLTPPRNTGMMRNVWPAKPGVATAALDDDRR